MNNRLIWVFVIFIGIAVLLVVTRLMADDDRMAKREAVDIEISEISEEEIPIAEVKEEVVEEPEETIEEESVVVSESEIEGWEHVVFENIEFDKPAGWKIDTSLKYPQKVRDQEAEILLDISLPSENAYEIRSLRILNEKKEERTFEQVVSDWTWDDEDVQASIDLMADTEVPITPEDIVLKSDEVVMQNGAIVPMAEWHCLKSCYIEGRPPIWRSYFIDVSDEEVYVVFINVSDTEGSDEIYKTLQITATSIEVKK